MPRSAFAPRFKAMVGATPRWRLTIAQARLRSGASIKAIAEDVGYANASALSRLFTQKVGMSPREWLSAPR